MSGKQTQIKPIETVYNGYHFRSRLEARWAVFFDAAGVKYEYEPEGFELEDGTKYLPDFYLPTFGVYAEVKPSLEKLLEDGEKISKCIEANGSPLSKGILILGQIPHVYSEYISGMYNEPSQGYSGVPNFAFLFKHKEKVLSTIAVIIPQMDRIGFGLGTVSRRKAELIAELSLADDRNNFPECPPLMMRDNLLFYSGSWCIVKDVIMYCPNDFDKNKCLLEMSICFDMARQARFEYGEKPIGRLGNHE